jgi:hypothetical protein
MMECLYISETPLVLTDISQKRSIFLFTVTENPGYYAPPDTAIAVGREEISNTQEWFSYLHNALAEMNSSHQEHTNIGPIYPQYHKYCQCGCLWQQYAPNGGVLYLDYNQYSNRPGAKKPLVGRGPTGEFSGNHRGNLPKIGSSLAYEVKLDSALWGVQWETLMENAFGEDDE